MGFSKPIDPANSNNQQKCYNFTFTVHDATGYISIDGDYHLANGSHQQSSVNVNQCFDRRNYSYTIKIDCTMETIAPFCREVTKEGTVVTIEPYFAPNNSTPCGPGTGVICP